MFNPAVSHYLLCLESLTEHSPVNSPVCTSAKCLIFNFLHDEVFKKKKKTHRGPSLDSFLLRSEDLQ